MFNDFLAGLAPRARRGLLVGAVAIVLATAGAAAWLLRTDNQVLFTDLKPQDAAMMVAELDRQKIPYQLADGGATILVDGAIVHATRLKLMGKDMPLHGAAGFELFNNGDFGMTEFAQKINYQRALQGEITRTILALDEVRDARVHLALPEEGLFKRASSKPKAAITLTMKAGQTLRADQVSGIQRLVAASVPGIAAQDVTLVDQQGVALTRAGGEPEADTGSARLDLKRDTEKLLTRKATEVLERAFGAGQAMATVDVTLNMDQVRVTTEDVIGTPGHNGRSPSGVVVRERETVRDAGPPLAGTQDLRASNSQREVDYQVGKRVEQVVTQPGTVRRIHVAAVVRQPLDAQQLEMARTLLTAAVGGIAERGDTVVVQTLKAFDTAAVQEGATAPAIAAPAPPAVAPTPHAAAADAWKAPLVAAVAIAAVFAVLLAWFALRRRPARVEGPAALSEGERHALAAQLKQWLDEGHPGSLRAAGAGATLAPRLPEGQA